jgi:hypothetical protein
MTDPKKADVIERELVGAPVEVTIAGRVCRLRYAMHAIILYKQQTGDSLFSAESWKRIDLEQDPGRWQALLWAGMHEEQPDGTWKAPFTLQELERELNFATALELRLPLVQAVAAWMPKKEDPVPNVEAPATPAPSVTKETVTPIVQNPAVSGFAAVDV